MKGVLKEEIRKIVAKVCDAGIHEIEDESDFTDGLDIDSMMMLEIVAFIEKELGVIIPEEKLQDVSSMNLNDLTEIVESIQLQ